MSKRYIWTIKLIKNLYLSKSWLILYSTHPLKKTNFSEGAILVAYSVLITAEKLVLTFAMNRLACCEQLCAISRNSLHYRQCYEETRVWGRYNVYFWLGGQRVNRGTQKNYISTYSIIFHHTMVNQTEWSIFENVCAPQLTLWLLNAYIYAIFKIYPFSDWG